MLVPTNRGFTLVELVICVAIFIFMTALLVSKYGNFNEGTLLTDTAYDVALTIRTAQSYGLSVRAPAGTGSFSYAYGVNFTLNKKSQNCGGSVSDGTDFVLFADINADNVCTASPADTDISTYAITRGTTVSKVCAGPSASSCSGGIAELDITFLRPNPDAEICTRYQPNASPTCGYPYGQVTLLGSDGTTRNIGVSQNGEITVSQ